MPAAASEQAVLDVTTATARLDLEAGGREAVVEFVVTNVGDAGMIAAVRPKFDRGPQPDWFHIEGPSEHEYGPGTVQRYRLRVKVPSGTEPLDYRIGLQAYSPDHPGEIYFSGPWVWLAVRERPLAPAVAIPGLPLPVASATLLGLLAAAACVALFIDSDGALAPDVWLPKAWLAAPVSIVEALVGASALWLLLRESPVGSRRRPLAPWWHVLASTVPTLVALCGALLWARAGWPWLVPSLMVELALGWAAFAWTLRRGEWRRSGGESSRVPTWWILVGMVALVLVLVGTAIGIQAAHPVAAVAAEACEPPSACPAPAGSLTGAALATAFVSIALLTLIGLSMLWLLRGSGPGTAKSLATGLGASFALLAVVGVVGWNWFGAVALAAVIVLALLLAIGFIMVLMKPELRLFAIVLAVLVCLYFASASLSLKNESGDMETAMERTRELVADARKKIKKEMDKPFILRLFGSLFGMEGNSFQKLKDELPKVLKPAMPKITADFSLTSPSRGIACEGMRLADALAYLVERDIPLARVEWRYEDRVFEGRYIQLGGTVLEASLDDDEAAVLVIQMFHDHAGEEGLGEDEEARAESRAALAVQASTLASAPPPFQQWLSREDQAKLRSAEQRRPELRAWRGRPIPREAGG